MSAKIAVVAMGRYGDVISVLPCIRDIALKEGGKCAVVISAEFASVLEGCSYVEPVVVSSHFTDYLPAVEQAKRMFEKVLVSKVSERSIGVTTSCQSFNEEAWKQLGYLNEWFRLPLVFDRRDREREKRLLDEFRRKNGKPTGLKILVNFSGKSATYPFGQELEDAIGRRDWIENISEVKAHRIYDLLALLDDSDLLITGDTSTLHLAAASGIPVINLIGDKPTLWHGSKPRNNSILDVRYSDSRARLAGIADVVCGLPDKQWKPRTWHVWSDYEMNGDTLRRHNLAKLTWKDTGWIPFPLPVGNRVVNDPMRSLPFIKDLVNETVRTAGPRDVIVLTNADTCVCSTAPLRIEEAVSSRGCCYSFRRDFIELSAPKKDYEIKRARGYCGADLFAFTVDWWVENSAVYPDVCLGAETWDWCLRLLMDKTGGAKFDDLIYHETHRNDWELPENRYSLPSQMHNKRLAAPFLAAHGVAFA